MQLEFFPANADEGDALDAHQQSSKGENILDDGLSAEEAIRYFKPSQGNGLTQQPLVESLVFSHPSLMHVRASLPIVVPLDGQRVPPMLQDIIDAISDRQIP
eukprot:CAMPEP_0170198216 /NCGR_PEP_ID=MMETSP0040_2-20121228/68278_1 /TAXON_ID=641309 /ORGANISM="Lotharella oceanica, Strain CCMP622" /LENGTH=101 /DNA_ID=CAMNT_0010448101 /DNA_START=674 /DNA_END=976 /DNA_ORIENTATION=+